MSQIVGEKFYDPDFFEKEYIDKIKKYKEHVISGYDQEFHEK